MTASVTPEKIAEAIDQQVAVLRQTCKIPDGKPCDDIERVVSAGVNYIVNGTIVDDEVYHPVTGFAYTSERIKFLVRELTFNLTFRAIGGSIPDDVMWRMVKFGSLSQL